MGGNIELPGLQSKVRPSERLAHASAGLLASRCLSYPRWADGNRLILLARSRRPVRPRSNAEAAFANAGTTRVQLSDLSARRMFTSYVRTQTRTSSVAVEVDTSEEGFSMNDARDEAINVSTFASQSGADEAASHLA